jgi:ribosomal protein S3
MFVGDVKLYKDGENITVEIYTAKPALVNGSE